MRSLKSTLLLLTLLFSTTIFAQEAATTQSATTNKVAIKPRPKFTLKDKSIEDQFDLIYKRSTKYQDYKVVKIAWFNDLKKNIKDSLQAKEQQWQKANSETVKLKAEVESLNNELTQTKEKLAQISEEKDSMSVMGMLVEKSTYQTILWSIIVVLIVFSVICYMLFKRAHIVTRRTQEKLDDTQEEFETHRKRALEREQVLARKLHTEQRKNQSF